MINFPKALFFEKGPRAVILLHSFTGTPNDHRMLGRCLEKANYTIYAPIFTNHCSTDLEKLIDTPIETWHQDGIKAVKFLRQRGYKDIAIMGLSLGGMIAIRVLTEMPSLVGGGCFCSPIMEEYINDSCVPENLLKYARYIWEQIPLPKEEIIDRYLAMKREINGKLLPFDLFTQTTRQRLYHIRKPLFIADAGRDEMVRPDTGHLLNERMHELNPGIVVTYKHYPTSKHAVTVSHEHKQLQEDVLAYLNSLDWKVEIE